MAVWYGARHSACPHRPPTCVRARWNGGRGWSASEQRRPGTPLGWDGSGQVWAGRYVEDRGGGGHGVRHVGAGRTHLPSSHPMGAEACAPGRSRSRRERQTQTERRQTHGCRPCYTRRVRVPYTQPPPILVWFQSVSVQAKWAKNPLHRHHRPVGGPTDKNFVSEKVAETHSGWRRTVFSIPAPVWLVGPAWGPAELAS